MELFKGENKLVSKLYRHSCIIIKRHFARHCDINLMHLQSNFLNVKLKKEKNICFVNLSSIFALN